MFYYACTQGIKKEFQDAMYGIKSHLILAIIENEISLKN